LKRDDDSNGFKDTPESEDAMLDSLFCATIYGVM
jgi:hypothetical protein